MDANGKEKIRMIMRFLETIHQEVSRILPDKEDNLASTSAAPKKTGADQISSEAQRNLEDACSDIENALDLMQIVVEG